MSRVEMRFAASMGIANMIGAAVVFLFLGLLLPRSQRENAVNVAALLSYMFLSMVVGCAWSTRLFKPMHDWVLGGRPTSPDLREYVVRHPLRQTRVNFALWMGSEVVFIPINAHFGAQNVLDVASTILLGAITTCGLAYLLAERILRPVCELAFSDGLPAHAYVPGVKSRLLLSWVLGSGVPLVGVVLMAFDHGSKPISAPALAFLGIVALLAGATTMVFSAKSVAEPVESVTAALADVEAGRLDIAVPVYDGSQIGQLQAGFNSMVDGLRERRRLRDLFGRQVGEDVAQHALQRGVQLGGEQMHVAVLFVDVIGRLRSRSRCRLRRLSQHSTSSSPSSSTWWTAPAASSTSSKATPHCVSSVRRCRARTHPHARCSRRGCCATALPTSTACLRRSASPPVSWWQATSGRRRDSSTP